MDDSIRQALSEYQMCTLCIIARFDRRCGGRGWRSAGEELGGGAQARAVASLSSTGRPHLLDGDAWREGLAGWCAAVGDVVTELNRSPDREELGVEDRCGGHGRRPAGEELGGGAQAREAMSPSSTGRPHLLDDGAWGEGPAGRCARRRHRARPAIPIFSPRNTQEGQSLSPVSSRELGESSDGGLPRPPDELGTIAAPRSVALSPGWSRSWSGRDRWRGPLHIGVGVQRPW
uniref:Uncharacterized protein n=1 Tax=Oryza nivara TaxID=4536 RepID=A0A0E0GJS8_ORYNI